MPIEVTQKKKRKDSKHINIQNQQITKEVNGGGQKNIRK